jgi:regulator of CtrA degradation
VNELRDNSRAVALGPRIVSSSGFASLYAEGMALIEAVAAYLDGPGREDSLLLGRESAFVYATESMRLTTRLMQLASWLLLQRAVNEGEITPENARTEKEKVRFSASPAERGGPGYEELPPTFKDFMAKGDRLFERVVQFDLLERSPVPEHTLESANGVADQLARLRAAFAV